MLNDPKTPVRLSIVGTENSGKSLVADEVTRFFSQSSDEESTIKLSKLTSNGRDIGDYRITRVGENGPEIIYADLQISNDPLMKAAPFYKKNRYFFQKAVSLSGERTRGGIDIFQNGQNLWFSRKRISEYSDATILVEKVSSPFEMFDGQDSFYPLKRSKLSSLGLIDAFDHARLSQLGETPRRGLKSFMNGLFFGGTEWTRLVTVEVNSERFTSCAQFFAFIEQLRIMQKNDVRESEALRKSTALPVNNAQGFEI